MIQFDLPIVFFQIGWFGEPTTTELYSGTLPEFNNEWCTWKPWVDWFPMGWLISGATMVSNEKKRAYPGPG